MEPCLKGVDKQSDRLLVEEPTTKTRETEGGQSQDVMVSILCGSIAGAVAKTAVAPAERVKMRFQISDDKFSLQRAFNHGVEIYRKGGILNLWRGHSTTIIRVIPYSGISYAAHDYAEAQFKKYHQSDQLPFVFKFLAGSIGGATGTFFTYPLDVLRVRLALTPSSSWLTTLHAGGLYQGLQPTMLGIIPYSGTAWMVKQTLQEKFKPLFHRHPTTIESLTLNAVAGLSGQFVTYPLDIVRRRMQMATKGKDGNFMSLRASLSHLLATEGVRGLSKGFSLNILKGPITMSLSLTTYDILMSRFDKSNIHK